MRRKVIARLETPRAKQWISASKNANYVPSGTGFKEQESILGFRRIRSENSSGSSSFSSRSLRAKRRRKPACTASFPSYDGASVPILAISTFTETDHRFSYSCRTGRAQGSLGYPRAFVAATVPCSLPFSHFFRVTYSLGGHGLFSTSRVGSRP